MTREEALQELTKIKSKYSDPKSTYDREDAHGDADAVLTTLLISLGYEDVVASWDEVEKWYS